LLLISGAVLWALRSNQPRNLAPDELYTTDHHDVADGLTTLPHDYAGISHDVPRLGPPLPADPGHLAATAEGQSVSIGRLDAEQQRANQETEAARTSKVFASTIAPTTPQRAASQEGATNTASSADETFAQNGQDRKLLFVNAPVDRRTTGPDRLSRPASTFVIQAGTIIPAALITAIRSDLPGQISQQHDKTLFHNVELAYVGRLRDAPDQIVERLLPKRATSMQETDGHIKASWCERALAALDDASRGTRQEMILQEALAMSSMFTRGHSDQVRTAIERGLALAEAFRDRARQLRLFADLALFVGRLGDIRGALAVAEQGGVIARAAKQPVGTVWAEWWEGIAHHFLGDQAAAQLHLERGMALAVELGTFPVNFFGLDQRVSALVSLAGTLWLRGFADQALRIAQRATDEAASRGHPVPFCVSLVYASMFSLWTGDLPAAGDLIEQLIAHARRYSLAPYRALGIALKGELAIARDEPEAGLELLRSALETVRAQQYNILITILIRASAEGLRKTGQFEEALFAINGAIARATNSGVEFDLPELLRIKSKILSARHDRESAMNCLTEALAVARAQCALAWELRSTTALARMLSESGQRDQARHTLALVYDRFTEGFETADLKLARTLLEDLR
jgi:tetratricopeptide (TPR) repeat protein